MNARGAFAAVVACLAAAGASPQAAYAQVGYPPAASPFRDLNYRQSVGVEVGYFMPRRDPAGVAPQDGPVVGIRYAFQFSNPFILSARVATASTERNVIDPAAAPENRIVGTQRSQLLMADVNAGLALTGFRSWHDIVPEVSVGAGFVSDFRGADAGGYKFGAPFAISATGGARWVPGGRWQVRADITDRLYRIAYPQSYYQTTGGEAVLGSQESNSLWTHNPSISIGIGYVFDR